MIANMAASGKPAIDATIDEYLTDLPARQRQALNAVRKAVHQACPSAVEVIGYRIPMFKYHGKYLVGFVAFTNHLSFSPWGGIGVLKKHRIDLSKYDTTKVLIRFTPEKPLPASLVKAIVKARMKEIDSARRRTISR